MKRNSRLESIGNITPEQDPEGSADRVRRAIPGKANDLSVSEALAFIKGIEYGQLRAIVPPALLAFAQASAEKCGQPEANILTEGFNALLTAGTGTEKDKAHAASITFTALTRWTMIALEETEFRGPAKLLEWAETIEKAASIAAEVLAFINKNNAGGNEPWETAETRRMLEAATEAARQERRGRTLETEDARAAARIKAVEAAAETLSLSHAAIRRWHPYTGYGHGQEAAHAIICAAQGRPWRSP